MGKLDLVKQFNRQCDDVVDTALTISEKYTGCLDDCIYNVKELLQNTATISNEDLEKYIALIPVLMYELIDKIANTISYVDNCVAHGTVPPKELDKCTYCKYKMECERNELW